MFVLQKEPRWTWPVNVSLPKDDGGFAEQKFSATFRFLPEEQRKQLGATEEGLRQILGLAVVEIHDVVTEEGQPVAHSPELLDALLVNPWTRAGLLTAYAEALAGQPIKAALGN